MRVVHVSRDVAMIADRVLPAYLVAEMVDPAPNRYDLIIGGSLGILKRQHVHKTGQRRMRAHVGDGR
jgi:hypothetical protein